MTVYKLLVCLHKEWEMIPYVYTHVLPLVLRAKMLPQIANIVKPLLNVLTAQPHKQCLEQEQFKVEVVDKLWVR